MGRKWTFLSHFDTVTITLLAHQNFALIELAGARCSREQKILFLASSLLYYYRLE